MRRRASLLPHRSSRLQQSFAALALIAWSACTVFATQSADARQTSLRVTTATTSAGARSHTTDGPQSENESLTELSAPTTSCARGCPMLPLGETESLEDDEVDEILLTAAPKVGATEGLLAFRVVAVNLALPPGHAALPDRPPRG